MMTEQELKDTLQKLPLRVASVRIEGRPGHLVAQVVSPDFKDQDESVRQQTIWEFLMSELTDDQRVQVEFVFTFTPEEAQEAAA
ncbi:MAG: hypothetical protein U0324_02930 [Polyangiales bacterium]